VKTQYPDELIN